MVNKKVIELEDQIFQENKQARTTNLEEKLGGLNLKDLQKINIQT